jgi:polar amino acid transport system substrate-binding protein
MMIKKTTGLLLVLLSVTLLLLTGCEQRTPITEFSQLEGKEFAVPTGTMADQLVLSRFKEAKFKYFNSVLDACMAVKGGKADAAAYDEPTLKNIAAKNTGMVVLPDMVTVDGYGFAVNLDAPELKATIDQLVKELKASGYYAAMLQRWQPVHGAPAAMPVIEAGTEGVLKFGTAAITEPFSFVDGSHKIVGIDIELAALVAKKLNRKLEIVDMDFGAMIPALISRKVDMIGSCLTISEERAKKVLFSEPYYLGGIAVLIRK